MDTLLVIGAESVVGANVAAHLADEFRVVAVSEADVQLDGCELCVTRWSEPQRLETILRQASPHWTVYCGPLSVSSWMPGWEDRPLLAGEVGRVGRLGETMSEGRWTFVSSDAVFRGPRMFHAESHSPTAAAGSLAELVLRAESIAAAHGATVVRTNAYGWGPGCSSFAERLWEACEAGEPLDCDACHFATPLLASDLADRLGDLYRRGERGLWHVAGAERVTPRGFARELAQAAGMAARFAPQDHVRPRRETSLDTSRLRELTGQPAPLLHESLARFVEQSRNGFRDRLQAAPGLLAAA